MPTKSRRRNASRARAGGGVDEAAASGGARASQSGNAPATGVRGWLAGAGRWMGDKYDAAVSAVSGFAERTGQAAQDLWDVAQTTDLSVEGGRLIVETDLDELLDVMPSDVRAALQLDREASDNRVRVSIDPDSKEAVIVGSTITVAGIDTATLQTDSVVLRGLEIRLSNPGGGVPFIDDEFSFLGFKDAPDNLTAQVSVQSLVAQNVVLPGPDGATRLAQVEVAGFRGSAAGQGGAPMGDQAKTSLDFSVTEAVMSGLARDGLAVDNISVSNASGGMYEGSETAFLAADGFSVRGAQQGGERLGSAQVSGARVDVRNDGGGLVGLDGKKDRLSGRVRVSAASVSDFDGAAVDLDSAALRGGQGSFDAEAGTANFQTQQAGLSGLASSSLDVDQADLSGFGGEVQSGSGPVRVRASASRASADGVRFDGNAVASQSSTGGVGPLDWGVGVDEVALSRVEAAGASVGQVQSSNFHAAGLASGADSSFLARADTAGLTDVAHPLLRASSASLSGAGMDWSAAGDANIRASTMSVNDLAAHNFATRELSASGGQVRLGTEGDAEASLERADVKDALVGGRVQVGSGQVSGVRATSSAEGRRRVFLDEAGVSDVTDLRSGGTLGSGTLSGVETEGYRGVVDANIAGAELYNGRLGGSGFDRVSSEGIRVGQDGQGRHSGSFERVVGEGLTGDTGSGLVHVDRAEALGGSVGPSGSDGVAGRLDAAHLRGVRSDHGSAATLSALDLSAAHAGGESTVSARKLGAADVRSDTMSASAIHIDGAQASHGASATAGGASRIEAGFDRAGIHDASLSDDGISLSASQIEATSGRFSAAGDRQEAGLGRLQISDGRMVSTKETSLSDADRRRAIGSGAGLIDSAQLSGSVPLQSGDVGSFTVEDGTVASGQLRIEDNQLVTADTSVGFSRPIDGPLWTSLRGVQGTEDGGLNAQVDGWFDEDITPRLNESLGLPGERLHSVGDMGAAASRMPSSGGDGPGLVDASRLEMDGSASLSAGTIDMGSRGSVQLAERRAAGQNQIDVSADGRGRVVASVAELLSSGFVVNSGNTQLGGGASQITDGQVTVEGGAVSGTAGQIDARDLTVSGPRESRS